MSEPVVLREIADGANISPGVEIGPYCTIGPNVNIGAGTVLRRRVHVDGHTFIGADNVFDATSDRSSGNLDFGGNFAFDVLSPAGADGRFIYSKASYHF